MKRCVIVDHWNGQPLYKDGGVRCFPTLHPLRFEKFEVGWTLHILAFALFLTDDFNYVSYNGVVMLGVDENGSFFFSIKPNDIVIPLWPPKKFIHFLEEYRAYRRSGTS